MADISSGYMGLRKTTLLDFPGEIAAILFLPGCNLRCPYCHNPELVIPPEDRKGFYSWPEVKEFIEKRKKLLGGVCISGGEPLLHPLLEEITAFIKERGLKIKLDTNGTIPEKLKKVEADFISMDLKTSPRRYRLLGGAAERGNAGANILESIRYIIDSKIPHEFRTTVVPEIVDEQDIRNIASLLKGAHRYTLAQFRPGVTLNRNFAGKLPYPPEKLQHFLQILKEAGIPAKLRGL